MSTSIKLRDIDCFLSNRNMEIWYENVALCVSTKECIFECKTIFFKKKLTITL